MAILILLKSITIGSRDYKAMLLVRAKPIRGKLRPTEKSESKTGDNIFIQALILAFFCLYVRNFSIN